MGYLAMALALSLFLAACAAPPVGPKVGSRAPDFALPVLGGGGVSLAELRGRPVLLYFGATWCPTCRPDYPHIQSLYREQDSLGVRVFFISIAEDPAVVAGFVRENGYSFPFLLDDGRVAQAYRVVSLGTKFVLDSRGVIRGVLVGPKTEAEMRSALEAAR